MGGIWAESDKSGMAADANSWGGNSSLANHDTDMWNALRNKQAPSQAVAPWITNQDAAAKTNQAQSRDAQAQALSLAQAWANGAQTPQQAQMVQGFQNQANGMRALAANAAGGARGAAAGQAQLAASQPAAAIQNRDALGMQQAQDRIQGQNMVNSIATQMREGDLQNLGQSQSQAYNQAAMRQQYANMSDQDKLFYNSLLAQQHDTMAGINTDNKQFGYDLANRDANNRAATMQQLAAVGGAGISYASNAWGNNNDGNGNGNGNGKGW